MVRGGAWRGAWRRFRDGVTRLGLRPLCLLYPPAPWKTRAGGESSGLSSGQAGAKVEHALCGALEAPAAQAPRAKPLAKRPLRVGRGGVIGEQQEVRPCTGGRNAHLRRAAEVPRRDRLERVADRDAIEPDPIPKLTGRDRPREGS